MVYITHSGDNTDKINEIVEAAQRRFGQYGFDKTTVSEIARDLNLSKASIYYYFPDKLALYFEVVRAEHRQFANEVEQSIEQMDDPTQMLAKYVDVNIVFFKRMLNMSRIKHAEVVRNKEALEMIALLRQKEVEIISRIMDTGKRTGIFDIEDVEATAQLFLDLLKGLRKSALGPNDIIYLDDEGQNNLVKRVKHFVAIFIKGITA